MKTEFGLFHGGQFKVERQGIIPFTSRQMVVKEMVVIQKTEEQPQPEQPIKVYGHIPGFLIVGPCYKEIWRGIAKTPRKAIRAAIEDQKAVV